VFERVRGAPVLRRVRCRRCLRAWGALVAEARKRRAAVALREARGEPRDATHALTPQMVAAAAMAPALRLARCVVGWVNEQELEPEQVQLGPDSMLELGPANGAALAAAAGEKLAAVHDAVLASIESLRVTLDEQALRPLRAPNDPACRYLLVVYGRQNYSFVAAGALNRAAPLSALTPSHGNGPPVFAPWRHTLEAMPGDQRPHVGAGGWRAERPLEGMERMAVEFHEQSFEHAARTVTIAHLQLMARASRRNLVPPPPDCVSHNARRS